MQPPFFWGLSWPLTGLLSITRGHRGGCFLLLKHGLSHAATIFLGPLPAPDLLSINRGHQVVEVRFLAGQCTHWRAQVLRDGTLVGGGGKPATAPPSGPPPGGVGPQAPKAPTLLFVTFSRHGAHTRAMSTAASAAGGGGAGGAACTAREARLAGPGLRPGPAAPPSDTPSIDSTGRPSQP